MLYWTGGQSRHTVPVPTLSNVVEIMYVRDRDWMRLPLEGIPLLRPNKVIFMEWDLVGWLVGWIYS